MVSFFVVFQLISSCVAKNVHMWVVCSHGDYSFAVITRSRFREGMNGMIFIKVLSNYPDSP